MTNRTLSAAQPQSGATLTGLRIVDIVTLPDHLQHLVNWLIRREEVTLAQVAEHLQQDPETALGLLDELVSKQYVKVLEDDGETYYQIRLAHKSVRQMPKDIWRILDSQSDTANVFISYSRRNKDFVKALHASLQKRGREVWVDWENIPAAADWWREIQLGIEVADSFIFVISPDSIQSTVCKQELEHALQHNKRIVPLVFADVDPSIVHPELGKLNWIFFRPQDDFDGSFRMLVKALDDDLDYVRQHTRLLLRATEWHTRQRDDSFLLRGSDLKDAETWLSQSKGKRPEPLQLQQDYIWGSRHLELAQQEQELTQERASIRRQRVWVGIVAIASSVAVGLGIGSFLLYQQAEESRQIADVLRVTAERQQLVALSKASEGLFLSGRPFEALLEAIRAGKIFQESDWAQSSPELRSLVITALQQSVVWVQQRNVLDGHQGRVTGVSFSADGQLIASASADGTVKLWRPDGNPVATLTGHNAPVLSVAMFPNSRALVSGSANGSLKLWRADGVLIRSLRGHPAAINSVAVSPNGQLIASASDDATVTLWKPDGTLVTTLSGHSGPVRTVQFSPDGRLIATGSDDATIKLWKPDGTLVATLTGHGDRVTSLSFSPNGRMLASGSWDKTLRLWNTDGTLVRTIAALDTELYAVRFSPDGQTIAASGWSNRLSLWHLDGSLAMTLTTANSLVQGLSFSPDGMTLASGGGDRAITLWQLTHPLVQTLKGHQDAVYDAEISPDGEVIISASGDRTIKIWQRDGRLTHTLTGHTDAVSSLAIYPNAPRFASASRDGTIKLWSFDGMLLRTVSGHSGAVNDVVVSPDGTLLASAGDDRTVRLWTAAGDPVRTLRGHRGSVLSLAFSPDGRTLVTTGKDNAVKLWRTRDGALIKTLTEHQDWVSAVAFSPDGKFLATASYDNAIKIWTADGNWINSITAAHRDSITDVRFSPDSQTIASAGYDGLVKLWGLDGSLRAMLRGHHAVVNSVRFSADGLRLISASSDQTVLLHDLTVVNLDSLVKLSCQWLKDYLRTNPNLSRGDRQLCTASREVSP
ncbi:MAG TPA: TIR domain-containing protein [Chroococcidiopsis sp.]